MGIDQKSSDAIRLTLARCTNRGADPVRALDELGHLWYPGKQQQLQADTLRQAADLLDQSTVKQLAGGFTPLDMKRAAVAWLRGQANDLEKKL